MVEGQSGKLPTSGASASGPALMSGRVAADRTRGTGRLRAAGVVKDSVTPRRRLSRSSAVLQRETAHVSCCQAMALARVWSDRERSNGQGGQDRGKPFLCHGRVVWLTFRFRGKGSLERAPHEAPDDSATKRARRDGLSRNSYFLLKGQGRPTKR